MRLIDAEHLKRWIMLRWESGVSVGYDDVKTNEILEQIDREWTINQEPRWIPCSERLPEDGQNVLVSYKTSEIIHVCQYHNDGSANPWYSYIDQCRAYMNVVTAWMPLPEPYEERKEQ